MEEEGEKKAWLRCHPEAAEGIATVGRGGGGHRRGDDEDDEILAAFQ